MRVLFASMELAPYSKMGGLGDVAKALPDTLTALGVPVTLITPWYTSLPGKSPHFAQMRPLGQARLELAAQCYAVTYSTPQDPLPGPDLVFVNEPEHLSRATPYATGGQGADPAHEPEGSILFCKAIREWVASHPEEDWVVHLNDHHTALAAAMLRTLPKPPRIVLTVHNFAYQGVQDPWVLPTLELPQEGYYPTGPLEFYGKVNFLKTGVLASDVITTVSQTYRNEVMSSFEFGQGLEGVMRTRADDFVGILNGIDPMDWGPRESPFIRPHFTPERLEGKKQVKRKLLSEAGLAHHPERQPLVAAVTARLIEQKGIDLILAVAEPLLSQQAYLVVMGTGKAEYESALRALEQRHPGRVRAYLEYDEPMAHRILAGSDIYLMPSRFEPCGLTQLYSLACGTVPVVRHTGGLADTVRDVRQDRTRGNGFSFSEATAGAFWQTMQEALSLYRDERAWRQVMRRGMREDHSWRDSARTYIALYEALTGRRQVMAA